MKQRIYKHLLFWISFAALFILVMINWQLYYSTAEDIRLLKGDSHYVNLRLPFLYVRGEGDDILLFNGDPLPRQSSRITPPFSLEALDPGEVRLELSLFGRIPLRQITVNVLPEIMLVPGGHSIGIRLHSHGVVVVGYYYFKSGSRSISPAREAGVRIGDTILEINGEEAGDVGRASQLLEQAGAGPVNLLINRDGKKITVRLTPVYSASDGGYRIGLYIRDSAAGVGTLSFYDPESGRYGALGHIIMDADTNKPINLEQGSIVEARIVEVKMARRGRPGEKTGVFLENEGGFRGTIEKNTPFGIFGKMEKFKPESPYPDPIPMALAGQVETGPAEMLTVIEGDAIESYAVDIERIAPQTRPSDKGMIIRVVDEGLLERTGGIIQGMSGSPIIQKGRLVGAVTHVFINDPSRGYAIFMEWMHHEAEILTKN